MFNWSGKLFDFPVYTSDVKEPTKYIEEELEFDKEDLYKLMYEAHKQDITLNQLINNILKAVVEQTKEN